MTISNVNGLGVGTPSCGAMTSVTTTDATYATSYNLTPRFSGQSSGTASVALTAPVFTHSTILTLKEGLTTGGLAAVPSSPPGSPQITGLSSGTTVERYLGVTVSNAPTGWTGGPDNTTLTFTMTVP
jgi:hypothetical protein